MNNLSFEVKEEDGGFSVTVNTLVNLPEGEFTLASLSVPKEHIPQLLEDLKGAYL